MWKLFFPPWYGIVTFGPEKAGVQIVVGGEVAPTGDAATAARPAAAMTAAASLMLFSLPRWGDPTPVSAEFQRPGEADLGLHARLARALEERVAARCQRGAYEAERATADLPLCAVRPACDETTHVAPGRRAPVPRNARVVAGRA